ncbi:unnamed protein product [Gordionus sp. m RMFG-2023]
MHQAIMCGSCLLRNNKTKLTTDPICVHGVEVATQTDPICVHGVEVATQTSFETITNQASIDLIYSAPTN